MNPYIRLTSVLRCETLQLSVALVDLLGCKLFFSVRVEPLEAQVIGGFNVWVPRECAAV